MVSGRTIVTGFRSFPGVEENPSERLVHYFGSSGALPEGVETRLLDTAYAEIRPALEAILAVQPSVLLMTGYSAIARGFKLERQASDICSPRLADVTGFRPGAVEKATLWLPNPDIDFEGLEAALLMAGLPCHLSDDAGEYVCNHSYYQALSHVAASGSETRVVFIHVPAIAGSALALTSASAMTLDEMARGVMLVGNSLNRR